MDDIYRRIVDMVNGEFVIPDDVDMIECHGSTKEKIHCLKKISSHIRCVLDNLEERCRKI